MARIQERKAAKDYPANGIAKGDTYFYVKIKTGPYSSRTIRSKIRPKRWELTGSAFFSQLWQIEDERFNSVESADDLREIAEAVRELGQEAQESFDNMPEGLQQGSTGELLEERSSSCDSWADEIDTAADDLENNLSTFDELIEEWKAYLPLKAAYDEALAEYEDDETGELAEPEEPDQPDLPDDMDETQMDDDDAIAEARQAIIDNAVEEATGANPGIN